MSRRFWDIDWSDLFPCKLDDDVAVDNVSFEDALPFVEEHYARIFGAEESEGRFLGSPLTEAKRRFCDESDVFLFRNKAGAPVGILMAHPTDWSTYYIRTAALLPDYRGKNIVPRLIAVLSRRLVAVGVERMEAEMSPVNMSTLRTLCFDLGFRITATSMTERWGALVRLTWFLSEEAGTIFHRQFCNYPRSKPTKKHEPTTERRAP